MDERARTRLPLAWHLIWNTYGTWLPGDARGWNRRGDPRRHPPSPPLEAAVREVLRFPPLFFDGVQRAVVAEAIAASCARRAWALHALAVQTSHVHLAVTAPHAARQVQRSLKGDATRALRDLDASMDGRVIWARGCRVVVAPSHVAAARVRAYVDDDHHRR